MLKFYSKIFLGLYHLYEVDLTCYEKLENPNLFADIENQIKTNKTQMIRFPISKDIWYCWCNLIPQESYSEVVQHIETIHLNYQQNFKISDSGVVYKYTCCNSRFTEYKEALKHFVKRHIEYRIRCDQCKVPYPNYNEFSNHINDCNSLTRSNRLNSYSLNRKDREN